MDFLRSCYSSAWRLFKGSAQAVPGYYYFSPPGTQHYPGEHNLGSRNWVSDDFEDPPLGETSGPQTYRKGNLPIATPPAVLLGSSGCISDGDTLPLPMLSRTTPAGVDSRCYSTQGLNVPDPPPALNLEPSGISSNTPGQPFLTWPDGSIYGRDATASDITSAPTTAVVVGTVAGDCDASHGQLLLSPLNITGDFAIFAVAYIPSTGSADKVATLGATAIGNAVGLIQVGATSITSGALPAGFSAATANNFDGIHLFSVVRNGTTVTVAVDGVTIATFTPPFSGLITVTLPATVSASVAGTGGDVLLIALQVFDQTLSSSGIFSVTNYLKGLSVGLTTYQCSTLIARNTSQAAAAPVVSDTANVTCTNSDYAVLLPAGCYRIVLQADPANPRNLLVFPPVGSQIDASGLNTAFSMVAGSRFLFAEISNTQWGVVQLN